MSLEAKGFKGLVTVHELRGISGKHNLFLPDRPEELRTLIKEIRVRYRILVDKHVGSQEFEGVLIRLSLLEAEMRAEAALEVMSDLLVRLTGLNDVLVPGDLYVKVVGYAAGAYKVRFTAVPPEVKKFLQSTLASQLA
jgi:adenylate cyclase